MCLKPMKTARTDPAAKQSWEQIRSCKTFSRREILAGMGAVGATMLLPGGLSAALDGKKTFTILHTNDLHSNFIGVGPASDYIPFSTGDDKTLGGYARLATLISERRKARQGLGPVLILDAGESPLWELRATFSTIGSGRSREFDPRVQLAHHGCVVQAQDDNSCSTNLSIDQTNGLNSIHARQRKQQTAAFRNRGSISKTHPMVCESIAILHLSRRPKPAISPLM
jgi:hypothetical protein